MVLLVPSEAATVIGTAVDTVWLGLTVHDDPDPAVIVVPAVTPVPEITCPTTIAPDCTEVTESAVPEIVALNEAAGATATIAVALDTV